MHSCCLLFTKDFPSDGVIQKVLEPFFEDDFYAKPKDDRVRPAFLWDWYKVGGRYGGCIKLKMDLDDEKYRWRYLIREPRNGRLFRSAILDTLERSHKSGFGYYENDFFGYMGENDLFLYVDAALADDIQNISEMDCYCFIDQNGNAFARSYYTEEEWVDNLEFDKQLSNAKENCSGCYICVVDLHD